MSDNEGQWAYVVPDELPSTGQLLNQLYLHNQKQQVMKNLQQQRELNRQAQQAKFVGENFKDSNYATGTAADPLINGMTAQARQKFAKLIHENPNMDEGELEMQMQGDISRISQYAGGIKAGRKAIEEGAQHYTQEPGIDSDGLKQAAIKKMVDSADPKTGQLDLNKDYLNDTLQEHPDLFVKGDQPLMATIEKFKPKKGGATNTVENAGVTTENKYTDQVYPWQSLKKDDKGNPTGVQVNGVPATLSSGQTLTDPMTKKPMQIVDNDTWQMMKSQGLAAQLKRDTDQYIKDQGYKPEDFSPGSEAYDILGRHILYNKLDKLTPSEFVTDHKKTDASIVTKMQLGVVDALGRTISRAEEKKREELLGSNYGKIRLAANLNPDVLQGATPYTPPGSKKTYLDVTDAVGGFKTDADQKTIDKNGNRITQPIVQKLLVDPSTPGTIYTQENGHIVPYSGPALDGLLTRHAPANGHKDLKDVKTINDGIPIQAPSLHTRAARAKLELYRRQFSSQLTNNLNPIE
jgi:hypothetical protein